VRNMRMLTSNLMDLARRDDGIKVENAATEPCFFDSILENFTIIAEENNRSLIAKSNIQQTIYTDKILLKQVMTILFDNAIKYTDQEGKI
ncbi:sensor histidine kinase, partial [Streptococcus pyogenes]